VTNQQSECNMMHADRLASSAKGAVAVFVATTKPRYVSAASRMVLACTSRGFVRSSSCSNAHGLCDRRRDRWLRVWWWGSAKSETGAFHTRGGGWLRVLWWGSAKSETGALHTRGGGWLRVLWWGSAKCGTGAFHTRGDGSLRVLQGKHVKPSYMHACLHFIPLTCMLLFVDCCRANLSVLLIC